MFDTTKEDLKDILRKVDEAKLQLPDFQRDYVWGQGLRTRNAFFLIA
ncbi:hypothetical protein [Thauera aminoaromatica]|nr:hypothetical protein [Thauera aminoaromatica]